MISIVVPVYNAEKYLRQCIESLIAQLSDDDEVLLVNDGSTDHSLEILRKYAAQNRQLTVISGANEGSVRARQKGVEQAKEPYITFVDADDWVEDGYLQKVHKILEEEKPDLLLTGYTCVDYGQRIHYQQYQPPGKYADAESLKALYAQMMSVQGSFYTFGISPALWSKFFKKEPLLECQKHAPADITIGEDLVVSYPCILMAQNILVSNLQGYCYRIHDSSMVTGYKQDFPRKALALFRYIRCFEERYQWDGAEQILDYISSITRMVCENELNDPKLPYRERKTRACNFLRQPMVKQALEKTVKGNRVEEVVQFLLRHGWLTPFILQQRARRARARWKKHRNPHYEIQEKHR